MPDMRTESVADLDRDAMAAWYARQHLEIDPGVVEIYHLPVGAPDREIRLLEVNRMIAELAGDLEPLDYGVDVGHPGAHSLHVLDVTPTQWERVRAGTLPLPAGWTLDRAVPYRR